MAPLGGLIGSLGAAQPITPLLRWAAGARLRHGTNVGRPLDKKAPPGTAELAQFCALKSATMTWPIAGACGARLSLLALPGRRRLEGRRDHSRSALH